MIGARDEIAVIETDAWLGCCRRGRGGGSSMNMLALRHGGGGGGGGCGRTGHHHSLVVVVVCVRSERHTAHVGHGRRRTGRVEARLWLVRHCLPGGVWIRGAHTARARFLFRYGQKSDLGWLLGGRHRGWRRETPDIGGGKKSAAEEGARRGRGLSLARYRAHGRGDLRACGGGGCLLLGRCRTRRCDRCAWHFCGNYGNELNELATCERV